MANTALTKITTRAKQIRKAHPGMAWLACVKKASAEYKSGKKPAKKVAGVKRKPAAKKTVVRKAKTVIIAGVKRKKVIKTPLGKFTIGSIALSKIGAEQAAMVRYTRELEAARARLKAKGTTATYKNGVRREIKGIMNLIATAKKNISALKRSI